MLPAENQEATGSVIVTGSDAGDEVVTTTAGTRFSRNDPLTGTPIVKAAPLLVPWISTVCPLGQPAAVLPPSPTSTCE